MKLMSDQGDRNPRVLLKFLNEYAAYGHTRFTVDTNRRELKFVFKKWANSNVSDSPLSDTLAGLFLDQTEWEEYKHKYGVKWSVDQEIKEMLRGWIRETARIKLNLMKAVGHYVPQDKRDEFLEKLCHIAFLKVNVADFRAVYYAVHNKQYPKVMFSASPAFEYFKDKAIEEAAWNSVPAAPNRVIVMPETAVLHREELSEIKRLSDDLSNMISTAESSDFKSLLREKVMSDGVMRRRLFSILPDKQIDILFDSIFS